MWNRSSLLMVSLCVLGVSGQSDINRQITDASNVGTAASSAMRQVLGLPINR
jgi:hypothetical protein